MKSNASPAKPGASGEHEKLAKYTANLEQLPAVQTYLYETNQIKPETVTKFKVGATVLRTKEDSGSTKDHQCLTFPWIEVAKNHKETLFRIKTQSITDAKVQRFDPAGMLCLVFH